MRYVDGFVVPVPKRRLAAYRRMARAAGKVWRDHGALEYVECLADDVKPGKHTSFPQSVKLKSGETVVFAYVVYESRAEGDAFRRQAHVLGRVQGPGRCVSGCPGEQTYAENHSVPVVRR